MTAPQPTDFKKIIADLIAAGLTVHTISKMMRRQYIQVQRWTEGVEPKHYEGEMLLAIHAEYVPRETLQTLQTEVAQQHIAENRA